MSQLFPLLLLSLSACSEYDLKRGGDASGTADDPDRGEDASPAAALRISPDPLDFGAVGVGCEASEVVSLENVGDAALTISGLSLDAEAFYLLAEPELPIRLGPGQVEELLLGFSPDAELTFSGQLLVDSNDPAGPASAEQLGEGATVGIENLDIWEIPANPPTDIMFSLDSSCSMGSDIWSMYLNFDPFISLLESLTGDWQVMVVNRDTGCNHSGILTPDTPDYSGEFKSALFAWNWYDDYTEALLSVNDLAMQETDPGECNSGFLRDGAMLHIIDISDEPEQSPELAGRSWDALIQSIIDKKGDPALTTISAIAGDVPEGCSDAAPGNGYWEATQETGGVFLSICDEWYDTSSLNLLAEASVNQSSFELSEPAIESSIVVVVNGSERSDWTYDPATGTVTLTGESTSSGDVVEISYLSPSDCG